MRAQRSSNAASCLRSNVAAKWLPTALTLCASRCELARADQCPLCLQFAAKMHAPAITRKRLCSTNPRHYCGGVNVLICMIQNVLAWGDGHSTCARITAASALGHQQNSTQNCQASLSSKHRHRLQAPSVLWTDHVPQDVATTCSYQEARTTRHTLLDCDVLDRMQVF